MKTVSCFLVTWITATALLFWFTHRHDTQLNLGGAQIILSDHPDTGAEFWHSLWVAAIYSLLNTFIVRFWQVQSDLRKKVV